MTNRSGPKVSRLANRLSSLCTVGILSPRRFGLKPQTWDTEPMAHPGYWIALVFALLLWAAAYGYAPKQTACALVGSVLAMAVLLAEDLRFATERRIREALHKSGHSITSAAICYFGKPDRTTDFEKCLRGDRPLDIARLEILLGDEFSRHYALLTLLEKGAPTYIRDTLRMVFAPIIGKAGAA